MNLLLCIVVSCVWTDSLRSALDIDPAASATTEEPVLISRVEALVSIDVEFGSLGDSWTG